MEKDKRPITTDLLKEQGHAVIMEHLWHDFDEMIDCNTDFMGQRQVRGLIDILRMMADETKPLENRYREAYDIFMKQSHSGATATWTLKNLRHFCTEGKRLADEIEDFKYDPDGSLSERRRLNEFLRPWRERQYAIRKVEEDHRLVADYIIHEIDTGKEIAKCRVYTTNTPMFCIEFPYRCSSKECLEIVREIGTNMGYCFGDFNGVPMFSFDTLHTFFLRYNNGMTEEDDEEFHRALSPDAWNPELADKILKERTWKHLRKH